MPRWTAPDLTDDERAALEAINAIVWDGTSHADRQPWAGRPAGREEKPKGRKREGGAKLFET